MKYNKKNSISECGDSALLWSKFFIKCMKSENFTIDEDLMFGWFANAIETACDCRAVRREIEATNRISKPMTDFNEGKDLLAVDTGNEYLNRMIAVVCRLKVGERINFKRDDFRGIYSFNHKGAEFTPCDRVIENIISGAYHLSYSISHEKPNIVTFKRHALKSDGLPYYTSPDKRLTPDAPVNRKPVQ